MQVSLPRKPFNPGQHERLVTLIKIQYLEALRLLKACLISNRYLVSIGNQCYILYIGGGRGSGGQGGNAWLDPGTLPTS